MDNWSNTIPLHGFGCSSTPISIYLSWVESFRLQELLRGEICLRAVTTICDDVIIKHFRMKKNRVTNPFYDNYNDILLTLQLDGGSTKKY